VRERARMNKAIPIRSKKIARKIPSVGTSAARRRMAEKIAYTQAQKIREQRAAAARKAAAQKIKARRAAMARHASRLKPQIQRPKSTKKQVVSWKAPYKFPNKKFQVITPSDRLKNLVKKDISRKKAVQQKTTQKTTHSTPSARRKNRLEALYGSHWHDIWRRRQK